MVKKEIFLLFLSVFVFSKLHAQKSQKCDTIDSRYCYSSKFETSAEYLVPTRFSDKIETISIHAFFMKHYFKNISLLISVGIASTYAWGITRQYKKISDTIFVTRHNTAAYGMGPALLLDYAPIKIKNFSLVVEASGGLIIYSNRFPYGGDIYNFMFRAGPSLTYNINKNFFLKMGYRWMHVSNGKGYGEQNPFYEAQGVNFGFIIIR